MKKLILLIVLPALIWAGTAHAQSANESKARAYYFSAQESFTAKDYVNALNYLQSAENLLGKSNARIEALRAKTLYHKGDIEAAKRALDQFYRYEPSSTLIREMTGYTQDIETKYVDNKARAAAARRAQAEKDRQARIAADKRLREQAEAAVKEKARQAQRDIDREKMRVFISEILEACINSTDCQAAISRIDEANKEISKQWLASRKIKNEAVEKQLRERISANNIKKRILSKKLCDFGVSEHCYNYANSLNSSMYTYKHKKQPLDPLVFQTDILSASICRVPEVENCIIREAFGYLKSGCDTNHAKSCYQLASAWSSWFEAGEFIPGTQMDMYLKGCKFNDASSCSSAAWNMNRQDRSWTSQSIQLAHKACDLSMANDCRRLAAATLHGNYGMKKNKKVAREYMQKYCNIWKHDRKKCDAEYKKL